MRYMPLTGRAPCRCTGGSRSFAAGWPCRAGGSQSRCPGPGGQRTYKVEGWDDIYYHLLGYLPLPAPPSHTHMMVKTPQSKPLSCCGTPWRGNSLGQSLVSSSTPHLSLASSISHLARCSISSESLPCVGAGGRAGRGKTGTVRCELIIEINCVFVDVDHSTAPPAGAPSSSPPSSCSRQSACSSGRS